MLAVRNKKISRPLVFITAVLLILLYVFTAVPSYGEPSPGDEGAIILVKELRNMDGSLISSEEDIPFFKFNIFRGEDLIDYPAIKYNILLPHLPLAEYRICEILDGDNVHYAGDNYYTGSPCKIVELSEPGQVLTVTFVNYLKDEILQYPGSITVIKTVLDSEERPVENDDTDFEFEIYYYEGDLLESFTLKNGESHTIDNLPLGMYNICEITDDGRYSVFVN